MLGLSGFGTTGQSSESKPNWRLCGALHAFHDNIAKPHLEFIANAGADNSGEVPKAFVVSVDPGLEEEDVFDYCRERLTAYKRPHYVAFIDELPKSAVGKVLRKELREREGRGS